ncbi:MAG: phospholipid carrier-dependent glycosyltransferase, partial [Deltaproteobacteria bacterium]|nr:phospholipid carrier-dependent glycosyltransferase [Deltaproteobacteria bacterium]
ESRYAEIPREMVTSGDWIVPRLNGLRYFEKPVAGYWLNALSMTLFGENAFATRLPSALSAGLSAMMLFFLAGRFLRGRSVAVLSALVFLACVEVFGVGTFSSLDSAFSMFLTGAMVSFFFAYREQGAGKRFGFLALSGVSCGLAFLTKGFLAFAVPAVAVAPFLLWEGRWKALFRFFGVPAICALLVSLPWAVAIHLRESDFWNFFFWNEHVRRFMAEDAQHAAPFWYYLLAFPGAVLPWTFLIPAAASGMRQTDFKNPAVRFALCWFLFPFLFFSFSSGKLITYILPCFPPFAMLMASGLLSELGRGRTRGVTIGTLVFALVTGVLAVALIGIQATDFHGLRPYVLAWKWGLGISGLLAWTGLLLFSARERNPGKKIALFGAAPMLFLFLMPFSIPDLILEHKAPGEFLHRHARAIQPDTILVSGDDPIRAVCWFYRRSDVYVLGCAGELSYGLEYEEARHRLLNPAQFGELVHKNRGTGRVILIAKARVYKEWEKDLPVPMVKDDSGTGGFVFAKY